MTHKLLILVSAFEIHLFAQVTQNLPSGQSALLIGLLAKTFEQFCLTSKSGYLSERELSAMNIGSMLLSQIKVVLSRALERLFQAG